MKIICIARWNEEKGKRLAEALASKLGYSCYSREELTEEATDAGIAVGKLETAVLKPGLFNERLEIEKQRYIAFATARLCEKAIEGDLVYHGRTGHLLLPGVSHVLRIRVEDEIDHRIAEVMNRLKLSREKAQSYVESVDDDIRKWVKTQYGKDWGASANYDFMVNLAQMEVNNAATALCTVATLPEFQDTPASRQALEDLYLAARVHGELSNNERTRSGRFNVTASCGEVVVTYQPQDMAVAESITSVAVAVDGVSEVHATMATSNLLWVQERFDPKSEACQQIVELASRWNVAVDLLRYRPGEEGEEASLETQAAEHLTCSESSSGPNGGIEDDEDAAVDVDDGGMAATHRVLLREGVAGGTRNACGVNNRLADCVNQRVEYLLVVLGELFLDKGAATRKRLTRELTSSLHETLKTPVIGTDELKRTYSFTAGEAVKLAACLAIVALIFAAVFLRQGEVLQFLSSSTMHGKILAASAVVLVTPIFAYLYGSFTKGLFKLIGME